MSTDMKSMWSELVALSHHVEPKAEGFNALRRADNKHESEFTTPDDRAILWTHPSRMAFHLIYEIANVDQKPRIETRLPYDHALPYRKEIHLLPHETKQMYDAIMPCSYGIVSFDARGRDERKEMDRVTKYMWKYGWKVNGVHYRVLYSHLNTTGMLVMVPVKSGINHPKQIGLFISSDPKAPKRVQRFSASYQMVLEAKQFRNYPVPTGHVYEAHLNNGRKVSILKFNMSLLDSQKTHFLDGSNVANLEGFDGAAGTVFGEGIDLAKGVYAANDRVDYDFVLYGTKSELRFKGDSILLGVLMHTGKHEARLDLQSITNAGFYEDHLATKLGLDAMRDASDTLIFGEDEDAVREYLAPMVVATNKARARKGTDSPEWSIIRMAKMQWESKATAAGLRRIVSAVVKNHCDVAKGKIRVPGSLRVYVRPNPLCVGADGMPDFSLDELGTLRKDGLLCVCIPDLPEGRTLIFRNPNTHRNEMLLVYNVHIAGLMKYTGKGWCFLGSNAGAILHPLNGGDQDDNIVAIQDEEFIAKWSSLSYPSQPKDSAREQKQSARIARMRDKLETGGVAWTVSVFEKQMKEWMEPSDSLGSFIIRGWIDTLTSGENRPVIAQCFINKTYRKPSGFRPATREELKDMVDASLHHIIPADYSATEESFVAVCAKFNELKPDFITAHAMSNSDQVIDWEVMKKGNKLAIERLHTEAKQALKTPYFPMCFENRIPADRKQAGNYILVETKLCRMLNQLNAYLAEVMEDARVMEHLIKRPLPKQLLAAYPADQGIVELAHQLNGWWIKQINKAKASKEGLTSQAFKQIAEGYDYAEEVKDAGGNITEIRQVHVPGFFDYYTHQFEPIGNGDLAITGGPFSMQTRRKIGVYMINTPYESGKEPAVNEDGTTRSVSDGKPQFIWDDIMDAIEDEGLDGSVAFIDLIHRQNKAIRVKVTAGHAYNSKDNLLSNTPDPTIPDGTYMMSPSGVIKVAESIPEMHSSYKAELVAARATGELLAGDDYAFQG